MRIFGIVVLALAALGFWVHEQRAQKAGSVPAVTQAGIWQPFTPANAAARGARRVRVTGVRLVSPAATFEYQVGKDALEGYIERVEAQAAESLAGAAKGTVLVQYSAGRKYQSVNVQSQGVDGRRLQALHASLMAMERLKVKAGDVDFELRLAVSP
ncbi:MAG: hypothetical protein AB1452_17100 [Pseudomonadota bacterium]